MPPPNQTDFEPKLEDVPVNRISSFNDRLQQYLHGINAMQESTETQSTSTSNQRTETTTDEQTTSTIDIPARTTSRPRLRQTVKKTSTAKISRTRSSSNPTESPPKRRRNIPQPAIPITGPTATESALRDTIPSNLILLLVGVNPGIMTGITGYAYAHPSNLFWKLLYSSGITRIRHIPADTYKLPELYSVGNTNIVERPTRDASMLTRAEMDAGVPVLEAKVAAQRPEAVCLVGKSIWEAVWRVRHGRGIRKEEFRYGWQGVGENMGRVEEEGGWAGAPVFVATTTSGLAAGMKPAEKEAVWAELGEWVVLRREERKRLKVESEL
ncbi:uncharacterized protein N7511_001872 [Penicillium nucicola]|uniref:uncharacterized protein n=1 Tax=Penicillium nucicola TaxID=1850975 RepID=UPI002545421C|nr:uncharacterized protein N7511_001872 [Penicillium nucicola]KAJ5769821.1 hypothetical protein N7511_001872 [Penicillium nucicola]